MNSGLCVCQAGSLTSMQNCWTRVYCPSLHELQMFQILCRDSPSASVTIAVTFTCLTGPEQAGKGLPFTHSQPWHPLYRFKQLLEDCLPSARHLWAGTPRDETATRGSCQGLAAVEWSRQKYHLMMTMLLVLPTRYCGWDTNQLQISPLRNLQSTHSDTVTPNHCATK